MSGQSQTSSGPGYGQMGLWIMGLMVVALLTLGAREDPHLRQAASAFTTAAEKQPGRGKSRYVRVGSEVKNFAAGEHVRTLITATSSGSKTG